MVFPLTRVSDESQLPYQCIGLLAFTDQGTPCVGTAFQIGSRFLLTSAQHCYSAANQREYRDWVYYPRAKGEIRFGSGGIRITAVKYPEQFKGIKNRMERVRYDYALLTLETDNKCDEYFHLANPSMEVLQREVSICGYPSRDMRALGQSGVDCNMNEANGHGQLADISPLMLRHNFETSTGNAGSPIFEFADSKYLVYGIHHGTAGRDQWAACPATQKMQDQITAWKNRAQMMMDEDQITAREDRADRQDSKPKIKLEEAQKIYEEGLLKYKQQQLDEAIKLFGESAKLFSMSPDGVVGNALCLSYSGMVFFHMKEDALFTTKALALLFSEAAVQAAQGKVDSESDVHLNHVFLLKSLPSNVGPLKELKQLRAYNSPYLMTLPKNLGELSSLQILNLQSCSLMTSLPDSLGDLSSLKELNLSYYSSLASLPESLSRLGSLQELWLRSCSSLSSLPDLEPLQQLRILGIQGCKSLRRLPISHNKLSQMTVFSSNHTFCLQTEELVLATACQWCEKSISFPYYSTSDLKQSVCLKCYRGGDKGIFGMIRSALNSANRDKEIFTVLLCSSSPAYYPYESRESKPALLFPQSLKSKVDFKCVGCEEDCAAGKARFICVGCAFFEGQSCALCQKCIEKVEKREKPLLQRLQKAQPSHKQGHSFVKVLFKEENGPETLLQWWD